MTLQQFIDFCLTYSDAYLDYPFEETDTAVIRHKSNRKWFALLMKLKGRDCVNLKCDPFNAVFLRDAFKGVTPGWHMNKTHWNTVELDSDVSEDIIKSMVDESFHLTSNRKV